MLACGIIPDVAELTGYVMTPIAAGPIAAMGYDGDRWQLLITYRGRRARPWVYFGVAPETWGELRRAANPGIYVHHEIAPKYHGRARA